MGQRKEEFSRLSSEYLLERRALGHELSDEAHAAIEEVFRERGEVLPPRPNSPIVSTDAQREGHDGSGTWFPMAIVATVALPTIVDRLDDAQKRSFELHLWIGLPILAAYLVYIIVEWRRRRSLPPEQRDREHRQRLAKSRGLTELMTRAAEGDVVRVRDLLNYGHPPNARCRSGTTALMYAVRNDQAEVVRVLLAAGADPTLRSDAGVDCQTLAARHAGPEVRTLLRDHRFWVRAAEGGFERCSR